MGKQQRDIIAALRRKYGDTFVAQVMLEKDRNTIGDEWTLWGTADVVRAIYNYLKAGFNSLSTFTGGISWQDVMAYSEMTSMPVLNLENLIEELTEAVSSGAKLLACRFIDRMKEYFNYIFGIIDNSETIRPIDRSTMDNVTRLRQEIENCSSYLDRLGNRAIEFIQWVARKMRPLINVIVRQVQKVFVWAGEVTSTIAMHGMSDMMSDLKSAGKFALRVGVFTFSIVYQVGSEGVTAATIKAKEGVALGAAWFRNVKDWFHALMSSIKRTPAVASSLKMLSTIGKFVVSLIGEERFEKFKTNAALLWDDVLNALDKLVSWLMKINTLPATLMQKMMPAFLEPLIEPVTMWFSRAVAEADVPDPDEIKETIAVAEQMFIAADRPLFLRDSINETKSMIETHEQEMQNLANRPWREKVDVAWMASAGFVQHMTGGQLTKQQHKAVDKFSGPAQTNGVKMGLQQHKLQLGIIAALFKETGSVTNLEDDETFARAFEDVMQINADEDEPTSDVDITNLNAKLTTGRATAEKQILEKKEGPEAVKLLNQITILFDKLEAKMKTVTAAEIKEDFAIQKSDENFKKLLIALGVLSVVAFGIYQMHNYQKEMEAERELHNEFSQDTRKGDTYNTHTRKVLVEHDMQPGSVLPDDAQKLVINGINTATDEEVWRDFKNFYPDFRVSQNEDTKVLANNIFNDLKDLGIASWESRTGAKRIKLDAGKLANQTVVTVSEVKTMLKSNVLEDFGKNKVKFKQWKKDNNKPNIILRMLKPITNIFAPDVSSISKAWASFAKGFEGMGTAYDLILGGFSLYAQVIVPLAIIVTVLGVAKVLFDRWAGVSWDVALKRLQRRASVGVAIFSLINAIVMAGFEQLAKMREATDSAWTKLVSGVAELLGQAASIGGGLLASGSGATGIMSAVSALSLRKALGPVSAVGTNTKYEDAKSEFDQFDIDKLVIETRAATPVRSAFYPSMCAICINITSGYCPDCDMTFCSDNCADTDWHILECT